MHRCSACSAPISVRSVVVELVTPILFVFSWERTGPSVTGVLHVTYGTVFLLIAITDLERRIIPHAVTFPAIAIAVVGAFINPTFDSPKRSLLGGAIGLLATLAIYGGGALFARAVGRVRGEKLSEVAFGFGDVTLTTFIGLTVGAPDVIFALVIGMFVGGVFAALYLVIRALLQGRYEMFAAIPYGPFLILGGVTMLYYGREFTAWYLGL
jgi:leader peptidase (prepilin peptidase)/N-methyltransferase